MKRVFFVLFLVALVPCLLLAEPAYYTMTVTKSGSGDGTVADQFSIDCGETCSFSYEENTALTLTATADLMSHFVEWSGACTGSGACAVTMNEVKSVDAKFTCTDGNIRLLGTDCGKNGNGVAYEECVTGDWEEKCNDPDICVAGEQYCDNGDLVLCELQDGGIYDWSTIDCDDDNECTNDVCDTVFGCVNGPTAEFTPCGDQTDTDCDGPNYCDGDGACLDNFEVKDTPCGDNTNTVCNKPDTCNDAGQCLDNFELDTTPCRDRAIGHLCDAIEYCDGAGGPCPEDKYLTANDICRPSTGTCDAPEKCDGYSDICPPEDYTATNGISCEDLYDYTDEETCANGECLGTEIIGSCSDAYDASTFPYVLESTTVGRTSHLTTYGTNCPTNSAPLGDVVVHVDMDGGVEYTISIERHGGWTGFIAIIPICSVIFTNATCLNTGGDTDSFTYTPLIGGNATLVVESLSGTGDFTLTIEREETPVPDDILPDETVTDETLVDEMVVDEEEPDEEVVDDVATDDILIDEEETDDAPVILDDGTPLGDDTVTPDDAAPADKDSAVADTTVTDTTVVDNEVPDEAGDELLGDEDAFIPGADNDKPGDDGCGCSLIF
ncbi:MAG TPA: hypothetical protein P5077_12350 [bacterium]|nr:hypothetical protein [bacterium]